MTEELSTLQKALFAIQKLKKQLKENKIKSPEPVAIIGLSCRFPTAFNKEDYWHLLSNGRNIISSLPEERWQLLSGTSEETLRDPKHAYWGGFLNAITDFDAYFFGITPREAILMDPHQRLLLEVTYEAIEDAGLPLELLAGSNTGVFASLYARQMNPLQNVNLEMDALYLPTGNAISMAANRLSYFFDLQGPSFVLDTACSSSLVALHLACLHLQTHLCDQALVCGAHINLSPSINLILAKARMLSPNGQCNTFSAEANGYVQGEGIGTIVLKPLSKAIQDQDRIYAVITGSAINQDGKTNGLTAPNGLQQEALLTAAYAAAHIHPSVVSYIECHGTGTFLGDPIELQALGEIVSKNRSAQNPCWIGSVKTNIGHLEPAAGIASIIKMALALQHAQIPPHLNCNQPNPHIAFEKYHFQIPRKLLPWPQHSVYRAAGISGFGFGGTNAHIVMRELLPEEKFEVPISDATSPELFTISAKNAEALYELINQWCAYLADKRSLSLAQICYNTHLRRTHYACRLAIISNTISELYNQLYLIKTNENIVENSKNIFIWQKDTKKSPITLCTKDISSVDKITLAKMYVENVKIDWSAYEKNRVYPCIDMPLYCWQHKTYWPSKLETNDNTLNQAGFYPLYGKRIISPLESLQFEFIFHAENLPELQDTFNVLHAGYYLDMLAFAMQELHQKTSFTVENLNFLMALVVPTSATVSVQLILNILSENELYFYFHSRIDTRKNWIKHAEGTLFPHAVTKNKIEPIEAIKKRLDIKENAENLYHRITAMGMPSGNSIRWTKEYWLGEKEIFCAFKKPESITKNSDFALKIHPGIIDGSIQPLFKLLPNEFTQAFIATNIGCIKYFGASEEPFYLISTLNKIHSDRKKIIGSWILFNAEGSIIAECENICLQQLDNKIPLEDSIEMRASIDFNADTSEAEKKNAILYFLTEKIAKIFSMPVKDIDIHQSLYSMGMDSLLAMAFTRIIETELEVNYPLDAMLDNPTIEKIADFVMSNKKYKKYKENKVPDNAFIYYRKIQKNAKIRLFCFPYGGAGASIYREWQENLSDTIEICPIQLPGRENRLDEQPITDFTVLIDQLIKYFEIEFNFPFAFFGHSVGALIGFELARQLRRRKLPQPLHLYVSAFPDPRMPTHNLDSLLLKLQENKIAILNTPLEIDLSGEKLTQLVSILNAHGVFEYGDYLKNKEVIKLLLPCFFGDMQLVKSYKYNEEPALDLPITVFWSKHDLWVPAGEQLVWKEHTKKSCTFHEVNGGHLFIKDKSTRNQILKTIEGSLETIARLSFFL